MNRVSFEGIGAVVATFFAEGSVAPGKVVKVKHNGVVAPCGSGDNICGLALSNENGCAGVQVRGFATVSFSAPLSLGRVTLSADGTGGVMESVAGSEFLVVAVDSADQSAVILL